MDLNITDKHGTPYSYVVVIDDKIVDGPTPFSSDFKDTYEKGAILGYMEDNVLTPLFKMDINWVRYNH